MSPESSRVRFAPLRTSRPARNIKSGRGIALRKRPAICERTARRRRKSVGVLVGPNPPIAGCLLFWLVVPKADRPKATPRQTLPPTRCQGLLLIDLAPESERPGEVLLMNRGRDQCRFPFRIDPSATGGYRFCAKQTSSDHVYCDHHHELVTAVEPRGSRARFNRAQRRIA